MCAMMNMSTTICKLYNTNLQVIQKMNYTLYNSSVFTGELLY